MAFWNSVHGSKIFEFKVPFNPLIFSWPPHQTRNNWNICFNVLPVHNEHWKHTLSYFGAFTWNCLPLQQNRCSFFKKHKTVSTATCRPLRYNHTLKSCGMTRFHSYAGTRCCLINIHVYYHSEPSSVTFLIKHFICPRAFWSNDFIIFSLYRYKVYNMFLLRQNAPEIIFDTYMFWENSRLCANCYYHTGAPFALWVLQVLDAVTLLHFVEYMVSLVSSSSKCVEILDPPRWLSG